MVIKLLSNLFHVLIRLFIGYLNGFYYKILFDISKLFLS